MTLIYRLSIALLIFGIIGFTGHRLLWPTPVYNGKFHAETKAGSYTLLLDRRIAAMSYTDKKANKFVYRGMIQPAADNTLQVKWTEQRKGEKWEPFSNGYTSTMKVASPDKIISREAAFQRVQ